MSQELATQKQAALSKEMFPDDAEMQKMWMMANAYSQTPLVCKAAQNNPASCFFILSLGKDLGISFTHALRGIYLTPDGKLGTEGNIIASLLWSKGFKIEIIESTHDRAEIKITRPDGETSFQDSFTYQEAEIAGLTKRFRDGQWKEDFSWKAYRKDKLYWRALMRVARRIATDVMFGLHLREEIEEAQVAEREFDQSASGPAPSTGQYLVEEIKDDEAAEAEIREYQRAQTDDEGKPLNNLAPEPVKPASKPEPTLNEQIDAHRTLAEIEVKQIRENIIKKFSGITKPMTNEYFLGWFGAKDKRSLPRIVASYLAPLQALQNMLDTVQESHKWLQEQPQMLGKEAKKKYDSTAAGEPRSHAVPDSAKEDLAASFGKPVAEALDDKEIFEDPLLNRFGWKNINTAIFAKALMVKWGHDMDTFEKHLRLLKMLDLPEPELVALLKMLWHSTDAYAVWKKGLEKKIPLTVSLAAVEKELGQALGNGLPSDQVAKAISVVAGAM